MTQCLCTSIRTIPIAKTQQPRFSGGTTSGELEANITSAVRNFLTVTGLVKDEEIVEENPPAEGSRRAVDLAALDTFIEFKRRIGTTGGFDPDPKNVEQLDDYLAQSQKQNRVRMGILTDGKYWLLRWTSSGGLQPLIRRPQPRLMISFPGQEPSSTTLHYPVECTRHPNNLKVSPLYPW